jgi:lysophospholipase L1-like esterase
MSLLTNADKLNIVNQHIKSLDFQIYNSEIDLLEANAESPVNTEFITTINARIAAMNTKRAALAAEAAPLAASLESVEE